MTKKQTRLLFIVLGVAIAYLFWKNGGLGEARRDLFQLNKRVSENTGGRVGVNRNILPDNTGDPSFGVSYQLPSWLTGLGQTYSPPPPEPESRYSPGSGYDPTPPGNTADGYGVGYRSGYL